jgi:hypothetical protein
MISKGVSSSFDPHFSCACLHNFGVRITWLDTAAIGRREFLLRTASIITAAVARNAAAAPGMLVAAYHDAMGAYHQNQFDASDGLLKKGCRIRSLSVYRTTRQTLYAAVWTNESGPAWQAFSRHKW